jgi:hypothetical protein
MRITRLAFLALSIATPLAACMPVQLSGSPGLGGENTGARSGFGGASNTIGPKTDTGGAGNGSGGHAPVGPTTLAYLCGGSQAACTPGPDSSDCAPGGNPNLGGGAPDAGATLTCHLVPSGTTAQAKCEFAGMALEGDVCDSAGDCQAGLGCGDTTVTGVCRQYCCGDPEACPQKTVCQPTLMNEADVEVPLCVPVTPCELLNDAAWCPAGETCTIVRTDGTTSCQDPGQGKDGEGCPCAPGYVCSSGANTCVKLCHVGSDECGTGTCQGGTKPYPAGIGFCFYQ